LLLTFVRAFRGVTIFLFFFLLNFTLLKLQQPHIFEFLLQAINVLVNFDNILGIIAFYSFEFFEFEKIFVFPLRFGVCLDENDDQEQDYKKLEELSEIK